MVTLTTHNFHPQAWMTVPVDHVEFNEPGKQGFIQVGVFYAVRIRISVEHLRENVCIYHCFSCLLPVSTCFSFLLILFILRPWENIANNNNYKCRMFCSTFFLRKGSKEWHLSLKSGITFKNTWVLRRVRKNNKLKFRSKVTFCGDFRMFLFTEHKIDFDKRCFSKVWRWMTIWKSHHVMLANNAFDRFCGVRAPEVLSRFYWPIDWWNIWHVFGCELDNLMDNWTAAK